MYRIVRTSEKRKDEITMNQTPTKSRCGKRLFLNCLLLLLIFSFGGTASAAVSTQNIKTVSGGEFVKKSGKWMYRYKNGSYAKNCLLNIDGKTYYFSKNGYEGPVSSLPFILPLSYGKIYAAISAFLELNLISVYKKGTNTIIKDEGKYKK